MISNQNIPKFVHQLFCILTNEDASIASWAVDGMSFQLHDVGRFEREVLPKYFKHNKLLSFQRQLNHFGFRKWTKTQASVSTFSHVAFTRDATPTSILKTECLETEISAVIPTVDEDIRGDYWEMCLDMLTSFDMSITCETQSLILCF